MKFLRDSWQPEMESSHVKKVVLEIEHFCMRHAFRLEEFENLTEARFRLDEIIPGLILELRAQIPKLPLGEVSFPADWWQAVKERWAPVWWKKRWPVRMKKYEAVKMLPGVTLPDRYEKNSFYGLLYRGEVEQGP